LGLFQLLKTSFCGKKEAEPLLGLITINEILCPTIILLSSSVLALAPNRIFWSNNIQSYHLEVILLEI
jgi:hypothetical protein